MFTFEGQMDSGKQSAERRALWNRTRLPAENLTNLRFADDVVLIEQSKGDITKMLNDFSKYAAEYGLQINFDKTKILTWDSLRAGCPSVAINGQAIQILAESQAEKYLGRKLSFRDGQLTEFRNRTAAAWAAFHKHKGELCSKWYPLRDRIRLFDATVTPTMLYACGTWALTKVMERELITIRRRMLRYVFRLFRRKESDDNSGISHQDGKEDWIEYLRRSARLIDDMSGTLGSEDWVRTYRKRKWRFAGAVATRTDSRWSTAAARWRCTYAVGRERGHPKLRWTDAIVKYAGGDWYNIASDVSLWACLEEGFVAQLS